MTARSAPDQRGRQPKGDSASESRRRRRFLSRGLVIFALVVAVVIALVLIPLTTLSGPTVQLPLTMEGMPAHLLNVWIDPESLTVGQAAVTAQVVDLGGNARVASHIGFRIAQQDVEQAPLTVGVAQPVTGRTEAGKYRAAVSFAEAGSWLIEVVVQMQGRTASVRFPVEVGP